MSSTTSSTSSIDYRQFKDRIASAGFSGEQKGPMKFRLQLLEGFMDLKKKKKRVNTDLFKPEPGTLTIIDLTDPFVDQAMACVLFDICLALFLEDKTNNGHVIALDEAHKVRSLDRLVKGVC